MKRILLAGDTHGDRDATHALITEAKRHEADLFVLGDFGYWEHTHSGEVFLNMTSAWALEVGVIVRFLDGNHENHPMLWSKYGVGFGQPSKVRKGLYYYGRGHRWEWEGVKFMSLGGAASVDKDRRTIWESWWPTELITDEDVTRSIRSNIDVLFCHDAPQQLDHVFIGGNPGFKMQHAESNHNRHLLQRVINITRPATIVHGHMHIGHRTVVDYGYGPVEVTGLENTDSGWGNENPLRGARLMIVDNGKIQW